MDKPTIVVMPGDGIGKVVLKEALRVLDATGFKAEYVYGDIGWEFWCKEGNPLPERTVELLEKHRIGLFGAITSKPKLEAEEELSPELKNKGLIYSSPIVGLRQRFGLDICYRPCRSYVGNPLNFIRRSSDDSFEEPEIDVVVFRQNTEGLYCGVEWADPPIQILNAFSTHPSFQKNFSVIPKDEISISTRIFTHTAVKRILRSAFDYAEKHGYSSVTVCEKPNVIRETSGLMLQLAREMQLSDYPNIACYNSNIDAQMMWLTKNPEDVGVIVASNMFGDIISDGFAGLTGGLGFAASAQYNPDTGVAVFEPTHGSAPKYADYPISIVNPIAMIESAAMMIEYLGQLSAASRIREAVAKVVAEGKIRTYDMMKLKGSPDVVNHGATSTTAMTNAIISNL